MAQPLLITARHAEDQFLSTWLFGSTGEFAGLTSLLHLMDFSVQLRYDPFIWYDKSITGTFIKPIKSL